MDINWLSRRGSTIELTRAEFIATLAPYAVQLRLEGSPMFPSVRLAQNLLETGGVIHSWNNLGGIKVGSGKPNEWWDGSSVHKSTWEFINGMRVDTSANFRAYKSVYHFYKDQDLLFQLPRYENVRNAKTPEEQCAMLQLCGYATDPQYPGKLMSLIDAHELKKYDAEVDRVLQKLQEQIDHLNKVNDQLSRRLNALEKKPQQELSEWALTGHAFVTITGISDGSRPRDPVTREEVWTMLHRALNK